MRLCTLILAGVGCGSPDASFFVTSEGNPAGGDLGGLDGADARCRAMAEAAGLKPEGWRAYLSTLQGPVHARDRIGSGPWFNTQGDPIAEDLDSLHQGISSARMFDERGEPAARDAAPGSAHDILTGSNLEGRLDPVGRTCQDWRSSSPSDIAVVGHHDWEAFIQSEWAESWTTVHTAPCDRPGMERQLGTGRLYCFAAP